MFSSKNKLSVVVPLLFLLLFLSAGQLSAYYFYDDFADGTVTSGGWVITNITHGGFSDPQGTDSIGRPYDIVVSESGGTLHFSGTNASGSGSWAGRSVMYGPFSASVTKPFGVRISLDAFVGNTFGGGALSAMELAIFKDASHWACVNIGHDYDGGDNYYYGYSWRDGLTEAPSLAYPTDVYTNVGTSFPGPKELRITHDGSRVRFYIDNNELPGPTDSQYSAFADSVADVSWNDTFYILITGAGKKSISLDKDDIPNAWSGPQSSSIDDCLVRTAVSTTTESKSEIYPKYVSTSLPVNFTNYILPVFDGADNAGVDRVTITLPSGYSGLAITGVQSDWNDNGTLSALTNTGGTPTGGQYYYSISGNTATIRLGSRITNATDNKKIIVAFSATTPSANAFLGNDIITMVDGRYDADPLMNNTAEPARLVSGDVQSGVDSDTITVSVYDQPQVEVAIDPYSVGQDVLNTTFNYNIRNASLVGNRGVTKFKLEIPTGFELQGVSSLILSSAEEATAISISNQVIYVDYGLVNRSIPAGGGTDVLSLNLVDSFTDYITQAGPHMFYSWVDDEVAPSGWIATTVQSGNTNGVVVTAVQPQGSAYVKPNTIFTSVTNSTFSLYLVNNGTTGITWSQIVLPAGFTVSNASAVSSSVAGTSGISVSNGNVITIDYTQSTANQIDASSMDIITIHVQDDIDSAAFGRKWSVTVNNGTIYFPAAQDAGLSVDVIYSPYGSCSGVVYPLNVISSITIYTQGTDGVAGTTTTDGVTGYYQLKGLNPGTYDIYSIGAGYAGQKYLTNIIITSNQNTTLPNIYMNQNALDSASQVDQTRDDINDPGTKITFPAGSIGSDTFVTITETTAAISAGQLADIQNNAGIVNPSTTASFDLVQVAIRSSAGADLTNMILTGDATLQIHYNEAEVTAKGWTENTLAIYYWDGLHWIKIGGKVDQDANTITAKVRNVSGTYAVFGTVPSTGGDIRDVKMTPNPFTPGQAGFGTATLTFTLNPTKTYTSVDVKIFNLRGRKVRSYKVDGSTWSAAVPWDGKDKDGYMVKSGIYIYQITAGGETYTGKVVMIR